jgi:mannan endo-1,4-beta-mannosidase
MSRNVIYFSSNANQIPLAGIANLPYTDVIVAFLVPDGNLNLQGAGGAFDGNLQNNIRTLQNAGKNVLISFGGAIFASSAYQSYAQNVNGLVNQIVNFVTSYGFNGVDIDYEDSPGFQGAYDGIGFLSTLTSGLARALPPGQNIITHAPQTPYWDPNAAYNNAYAQIWQRVGNQIAWINNQFYNNSGYDQDAATKVLWYQRVAAITGAQKLLVGAAVAPSGAGEGYITLDDMIQNVITPLKSNFGSQFGGVMGWEFALDQDGTWANGIGQALGAGVVMACPGQSYTVAAGDTLYLIAQRFLGDGTRWVELTKPGGTPFTATEAANLQIGQVVCIPGQQPTGSKVLNFLRSISGSRTVAGEHNREPNSAPAMWTNWIHDPPPGANTGRYPGLWSGDFLFEQVNIDARQTMINEAKNQWQQGALINLMYHACPPTQGEACDFGGGVLSSLTDAQWNELITDGSNLNSIWKARLDVISGFLQDLKDNGVEVLWRPLHEMNQGKFWWGGRPGPQGTARLYQITHDYMVGIKGLTNLIWVWDVQDLDFNWAPYNPGDSYWDVLAMDMYGDGYTTQKYQTLLQLAGGKPIAIGECEILPTAAELAAQPRWTFFMAWAELVHMDGARITNTIQQIQDLYNAANVITRDQLPGWLGRPPSSQGSQRYSINGDIVTANGVSGRLLREGSSLYSFENPGNSLFKYVNGSGPYYQATIQTDGNFVVYYYDVNGNRTPKFWTNTGGKVNDPNWKFVPQSDGNLVLYRTDLAGNNGAAMWSSNTYGVTKPAPGDFFGVSMQQDSNLVLYLFYTDGTCDPVWATFNNAPQGRILWTRF